MLSREGGYYLVIFLGVFAAALTREINLLMVLSGLMAGPMLLSRFLAVQMLHGLQVRRRLPQGVCAGDLLVANVALSNPRSRLGAWAVVVEDRIVRQSSGDQGRRARRNGEAIETSVLFPYVAAGKAQRGVYQGRLAQRGRYRAGPLRMSTRFPFGLLRQRMTLDSTATFTVLPRLGRLTRGWMTRHRESFAGTDRREIRAGIEGDFYGLRHWQRGDSRRWIDWRSTARSGKLVVRQFEKPRNRDVAVLVDLRQSQPPGPQHLENVELAVSFAATVVADLCRAGGSEVYLGLADPQPRMTGGPASAALLTELMERLALVEPQPNDHTCDLIERVLDQVDHGTEIVLVSTRPVRLTDALADGRLSADPARAAAVRRIRVVDTSSPELAKYFQAE